MEEDNKSIRQLPFVTHAERNVQGHLLQIEWLRRLPKRCHLNQVLRMAGTGKTSHTPGGEVACIKILVQGRIWNVPGKKMRSGYSGVGSNEPSGTRQG